LSESSTSKVNHGPEYERASLSMPADKEFRLGLIALGGIAHVAHGPAIRRFGAGVTLAAACDIRPGRG
jgi:hypothetical protein